MGRLDLFWGLDGRIDRQTYWFGFAVVLALAYFAGPLQSAMDQIYDAVGNLQLKRTETALKSHVEGMSRGDPNAQELARTAVIQHLAERVGMGAWWFAGFIVLALVILRGLIALVLKRMADAGYPRPAGWCIFGLLFLANLFGPVPFVGAAFQVSFLLALVVIGCLPSEGAPVLAAPATSAPPSSGSGQVPSPAGRPNGPARPVFGRR